MYCSRILRMVHNYFTGGTYQFLMIAEHMLTLPTSALITLHCVLKKALFGNIWKPLQTTLEVRRARFRPDLYLMKCKGSAAATVPPTLPRLPAPGDGGGERSRAGPGAPAVEAPAGGLPAVPGEGGVRGTGRGGDGAGESACPNTCS